VAPAFTDLTGVRAGTWPAANNFFLTDLFLAGLCMAAQARRAVPGPGGLAVPVPGRWQCQDSGRLRNSSISD
jgi:hypothetical protein